MFGYAFFALERMSAGTAVKILSDWPALQLETCILQLK